MAVSLESVATICRGVMATPMSLAWLPGLVTVTVLSMVNDTVPVPVNPAESVAWTVAEYDPAVVGVPVMTPPDDSVRPGGREPPVVVQLTMVAPPWPPRWWP